MKGKSLSRFKIYFQSRLTIFFSRKRKLKNEDDLNLNLVNGHSNNTWHPRGWGGPVGRQSITLICFNFCLISICLEVKYHA